MMRKAKRLAAIRTDKSKPLKAPVQTKPAEAQADVEIRKYGGTSKGEKADAGGQSRKRGRAKARFDRSAIRRPRQKDVLDLGDQRAKRVRSRASSSKEEYIRLRIRVRDSRLKILDSHLVDGPLARPTGFPAGNAYEVTLDDRLLHAEALPDLGVQRSFPNPKGPEEQHGHYITEQRAPEFFVRISANEVSPDTIGKIVVRLYRVKEEVRADRLEDAPLARQFERAMRPVAELVGLPDSVLPEAIERRGGRTANA